ncbi:hypothetical protein [Xenorhabdus szentirmaii]|uniref:hypothetical protein n=1 Tax=Xenorhabdus szentirmaii TaxID=290112 RepID=UPI0019B0E5EA|nr:hypothetical protein [Xenorhabdus sp. 42]MBD2804993.1 hypothetical protein [Xenorhabdus sp. ZM]
MRQLGEVLRQQPWGQVSCWPACRQTGTSHRSLNRHYRGIMGKVYRLFRWRMGNFTGQWLKADSQLEERSRIREVSDKMILSLAGETK